MSNLQNTYAPQSLWSPNLLVNVDYTCFKQNKEQKSDILSAKWQHKMYMLKKGLSPKKWLNAPEHRLDTPIVITT